MHAVLCMHASMQARRKATGTWNVEVQCIIQVQVHGQSDQALLEYCPCLQRCWDIANRAYANYQGSLRQQVQAAPPGLHT